MLYILIIFAVLIILGSIVPIMELRNKIMSSKWKKDDKVIKLLLKRNNKKVIQTMPINPLKRVFTNRKIDFKQIPLENRLTIFKRLLHERSNGTY